MVPAQFLPLLLVLSGLRRRSPGPDSPLPPAWSLLPLHKAGHAGLLQFGSEGLAHLLRAVLPPLSMPGGVCL